MESDRPLPDLRRQFTPVVVGAFAGVATVIAALAAFTVLVPGTALDAIWTPKPAEYAQLRAMGPLVGVGFAGLAVVAAATAYGTLHRRRWAWWLAVVGLAINALSDAARMFIDSPLEGAVGVVIAGAILWWLLRPAIRSEFR